MGIRSRRDSTQTMKQMQQDDLAKQAVLRYQANPSVIQTNTHPMPIMRVLADEVAQTKRPPQTVGEWLALIMFYGKDPHVRVMRQQAEEDMQAAYIQAQRWLELIDNSRY